MVMLISYIEVICPSGSDLGVMSFNHSKNLNIMTSEEKVNELLFLSSGAADEKDERTGVSLGLKKELEKRKQLLYRKITFLLVSGKMVRNNIRTSFLNSRDVAPPGDSSSPVL